MPSLPRLLTLDRDLLMIPSVAIHMNREVNDKASYNKQVDMLPLLGGAAEEGVREKLVAAELQVAEDRSLAATCSSASAKRPPSGAAMRSSSPLAVWMTSSACSAS